MDDLHVHDKPSRVKLNNREEESKLKLVLLRIEIWLLIISTNSSFLEQSW